MELTPQLQQRIDVLRMTGAEVQAHLERQARENPALERVMAEPGVRKSGEESPEGAPAPDVCVGEVDGEYAVYFPGDEPAWRVSDSCLRALARPGADAQERESIKVNVRSAVDLLRNVEHRRQSIYLVAECVIRSQPDDWEGGPSSIRPVGLGEVARATGMSGSAVSRAVAGKLIQTRHGVFELRRFFAEG